MNRIISACTALAITLSVVIYGLYLNTTTSDKVSDGIYSAMEKVKKDDIENAKKEIKKTEKFWDEKNNMMLIFTAHDKLDTIDESIHTAEAYLEAEEKTMFIAECRRILTLLDHFREIEYPSLNNIF